MAEFEFKAPTSKRPLVGTIVTGVIVLILVAILIWAIVRHFSKTSTTEPDQGVPGTSQNEGSDQGSSGSSGDSSTDEDNSSSANGSGSESQQSGGEASKPKKSSDGSQLADTGPGDVVAVFVGASVLGAAGYYVYLRRRLVRG